MHLLAENPVLFFQIVDDLELLAVDPAREKQEQKTQRLADHGEVGGCHNTAPVAKLASPSALQAAKIGDVSLDLVSAQDAALREAEAHEGHVAQAQSAARVALRRRWPELIYPTPQDEERLAAQARALAQRRGGGAK